MRSTSDHLRKVGPSKAVVFALTTVMMAAAACTDGTGSCIDLLLDNVSVDIGRAVRDSDVILLCHRGECVKMVRGGETVAVANYGDELDRRTRDWYLGEYEITVSNESVDVLQMTMISSETSVHMDCDAVRVRLSIDDLK